MNLFDNTLRDGGNVVGHGFSGKLTESVIKGLLGCGIKDIEFGNCKGLGAYDKLNAKKALSDLEYLKIVEPYVDNGRIGMFMMAGLWEDENIKRAKGYGLNFLRVGANAGDGEGSVKAVEAVKRAGLICRYSLMKAYVLPPSELANEARMLENAGVDKITIMDSAGTMFPDEVKEYVSALKAAVTIPVGFHGHSNLGLSQANALAAVKMGADEIDCGLLGMARSAGNCTTELAAATLKKEGYLPSIDLYKLLDYLEGELIPAMKEYDYKPTVYPTDLMLGLAGFHSNFLSKMTEVSKDEGVSLFKLIVAVSEIDRKNPSEELMRNTAKKIK